MKLRFLSLTAVVLVALFAAGGPRAAAQARVGTWFTGSVGDLKVEMDLRRDGDSLTGSYYSGKSGSGSRLMLSGKIAEDGSFTMQETDAAGKPTGSFKGKWKEDANDSGAALEGEWIKPGQKEDGGLGFYAFEQMVTFTNVQLTTREFKETIKLKKAELSAEYPELAGSPNAAGFNQIAKAAVMRSIAAFKKDLSAFTAADIKQLGEMGNYIEIGYNVEYADDDLISVNFGEDTFEGGAHPNHGTFTLTYDLKAGRELKLADLFKPGAKYLSTISAYVIRDLKARKDPETGENLGIAQDMWEDGAKPAAENYQNWNVTKKGLLITFPPYQVAAYAYGPQTVIVPYSHLAAIARPDGALAKAKK